GVRAVERAHLDRVTGHTPFEVVANVFLATDRRRREACGNRTTVDLGVLHDAALPAAGGVAPLARAIAHAGRTHVGDGRRPAARTELRGCHRDRGAQLRGTPVRQTVAHHRSVAEAGGEHPALIDAQVIGDQLEQVVKVDAVFVVVPERAGGVCVGCYEDGGLAR